MLKRSALRIVVMHRHPVMAAGLVAILEREADFVVARVDFDDDPAMADAPAGGDTVVVADHLSAIDLAARCAASRGDARILALACASRAWQVRSALQGGVHGYIAGDGGGGELARAVRRVHGGERYLCAQAARCIAESLMQQHLTRRELDVLRLVGEGLDNKTISARLEIALGTVKVHVRTLLDKLDASSRTEAAAEGTKRGFIGEGAAAH